MMHDPVARLLEKLWHDDGSSLELRNVGFRGDHVVEPLASELADEIAAMANTKGGVLVLGVDDKSRDIQGIPRDKLDAAERFVFEICNDSIKPPVGFRAFRMELPDAAGVLQAVMKVDVPRSLSVHKSPRGYFWRQGRSTRELPQDLLLRLLQQRSQARLIRFDEQAVPETGLGSLDEELWRRFLSEWRGDPVERLHKRGLLTRDDRGQERCTVSGVLMCARDPSQWLPGALVSAVRYRGMRQDTNYQMDAQELRELREAERIVGMCHDWPLDGLDAESKAECEAKPTDDAHHDGNHDAVAEDWRPGEGEREEIPY